MWSSSVLCPEGSKQYLGYLSPYGRYVIESIDVGLIHLHICCQDLRLMSVEPFV